jgi:hypothetical protein
VLPGRVSRVLDVANQLNEVSQGLLRLAALMQRLAPSGWQGIAARQFSSAIDLDSRPVARAGAVMAQAADHLRRHAAVLDRAQRLADDAVRADLQASRVTAQWQLSGAVGADPMADTRLRLATEVDAARSAVRTSAAESAQALRRCRDLAPEPRQWWQRPGHRFEALRRDVATGSNRFLIQLLSTALVYGPQRLVTDPVGYTNDVNGQVAGAAALATRPGDLARAVLDLDTWDASKQIWAGAALPGLALSVATDNPFASTRLSTFAFRARAAMPTERGAAMRSAIAETGRFSRSGLRVRDLRGYASEPSELGTVTRLDPLANAVAEGTLRDARFSERLVSDKVQNVADRVGGERVKPEYVLKDPVSLRRKFAGELVQAPPSRVAATLNDTVRYTIIYPDAAYAERSVRTVEALRAQDFDVLRAKSTWEGQRYRGLNVTLHDPRSGRLFEVQTHTPESFRAGEDTRHSYGLFRDVGVEPVHKAMLEREIGDRYRLVPTPPGVGDLPLTLRRFDGQAAAESTAPSLVQLDPRRAVQLAAKAAAASGVGNASHPAADPP